MGGGQQRILGEEEYSSDGPRPHSRRTSPSPGGVLKKINLKKQQQQMMLEQQNRHQHQQQQQQQQQIVQWPGQTWVRVPSSNFLTVPQPNFYHPALFDTGCSYLVNHSIMSIFRFFIVLQNENL
jgi:hypothetical protein